MSGSSGEAWPLDINPTEEHLKLAAEFANKADFEMSDPASEAIIVHEIAELIAMADSVLSSADPGEDYRDVRVIEGNSITVYGIKTHDGPQFFIGGKNDD